MPEGLRSVGSAGDTWHATLHRQQAVRHTAQHPLRGTPRTSTRVRVEVIQPLGNLRCALPADEFKTYWGALSKERLEVSPAHIYIHSATRVWKRRNVG